MTGYSMKGSNSDFTAGNKINKLYIYIYIYIKSCKIKNFDKQDKIN